MNELQQCMQMEVMGGGVTGFFFCVVIGTAIYKMFRSGAGRVSIPKIISIEWRLNERIIDYISAKDQWWRSDCLCDFFSSCSCWL